MNIDKEKLESTNCAMAKEQHTFDDKVEALNLELSNAKNRIYEQEEELERNDEELSDNKIKRGFLQNQLAHAKLKIEQVQSKLNDEGDDMEVLENIVKNKEEMILTLK